MTLLSSFLLFENTLEINNQFRYKCIDNRFKLWNLGLNSFVVTSVILRKSLLSIKKSVKLDRISEQLNRFVLDSNKASIEKVWYLSQSNKGGFKLVSCGFAYTVDKPKLHVIKSGQASTISWKCDTLGCKGRGKSNELNPPFSITVAHYIHKPSVEKLTK